MSGGNFIVDRGVWDHPVFRPGKFTDAQAFIWLISEASWRPRTIRDKSFVIDLERGQLTHSLRFLAKKWQWRHDAVKRYLLKLEKHAMVRVTSATGQTVITICNYGNYQIGGDCSATVTATATATGPRQDRDKEENLIKPEGKPDKRLKPKKPPAKSLVFDILSKVAGADAVNGFIEMRWNIKAPMTERSAKLIADKLRGRMDADAILDLSTENNWKTVYPDSDRLNGGHNGNGNHHNGTPQGGKRPDPALEQIARLAGIGEA